MPPTAAAAAAGAHDAAPSACLACTSGCSTSAASKPRTILAPRQAGAVPGAFGSPITPPGTNTLAAASPATPHCSALSAYAGAEPAPGTASASTPQGLQSVGAELLARAQGFAAAVLGSPLLQSALLALEAAGSHPAPDERSCTAGLEWTLAQLFVLHAKSGCAAASELQLLAALWTLESWGDVERSCCSDVLYSYLQGLPLFDRELAREMARDWQAEFLMLRRVMNDAQVELLKGLGWVVRLDFATEVAPSRNLLFAAVTTSTTPGAGVGSATPAWAAELQRMCRVIAAHASATGGTPGEPSKRRRYE